MAKYKILAGTASYKPFIFIQDATSSTGAGLASLVFSTSGLTAYYCRDNDTASTAITLASGALGTYASGGFIAADNTNMPGLYQIGLPNAALAAGANKVTVYLKGAAAMVPVVLEIELDGINYQDGVRAGLTALPNASAGAALGLPKLDAYANNRVSLYSVTTQATGPVLTGNADGTQTATLAGGLAFPAGTIAKSAEITTLTTALVPTAGTIATGSAGTAIKTTLTAPSANAYKGQVIVYTSGALTGQSHLVRSNTAGANSVLTIFTSLVTSPSLNDTFSLVTGVGQKIVDMLSALGSDNKALISTDAQTGLSYNNTGQTTNLPANVAQIGGQTASAAAAVAFPASVGTSTYAGGDTTGTGTLLNRIGSNLTIAGGKVAATLTTGDNGDKLGYTLTVSPPTLLQISGLFPTEYLTSAEQTFLAKLDATVSSRSTYAGGLADTYAAAIKTQTDKIGTNGADSPNAITAQTTISGLVAAVWDTLTSATRTAGSYGAKLKAWVLGTDSKALLSTDAAQPAPSWYVTPPALPADYLTSTEQAQLANIAATLGSPGVFSVGALFHAPGGSGAAKVQVDLTQALDATNTGDTVGGALLAARADGFGKWTLVSGVLTIFAADGVTAVRSFTITPTPGANGSRV